MSNVFDEIDHYIGGVQPEEVPRLWPALALLLAPAIRRQSGHTLDDLRESFLNGTAQCWVVGDFQGAVVTSLQDYPQERVLYVQFLSGEGADEWLPDLVKVLNAFAEAEGCAAVEFVGRRGWRKFERAFPDYKPRYTIYRREVPRGGR